MFFETRKWTSSQCSCCPDWRHQGTQHDHDEHWKGGLWFIQHLLFHKGRCRVLYNDANINTQNSVIRMDRPSAETETFTYTCRRGDKNTERKWCMHTKRTNTHRHYTDMETKIQRENDAYTQKGQIHTDTDHTHMQTHTEESCKCKMQPHFANHHKFQKRSNTILR